MNNLTKINTCEEVCSNSFAKINPFLANVPILYPLKTPENLWFSSVFRGYKMGKLARNGLEPNLTTCEMAGIGALQELQLAVSCMKCIVLRNEAIKISGSYFS